MRSRKLSPGFAVTRTTIRSESTRVPPVTALRSPPDSRMTGADSPVIADSSTVAAPSSTSPSAATISPASTTNRSPLRRLVLATRSSVSVVCAAAAQYVSDFVRRRASACALPRPSATASAKLAKSTVNQSHAAIAKSKPAEPVCLTQVAHEEDRRCRGPDFDDEHHRVASLPARIELLERIAESARDDRPIEERTRFGTALQAASDSASRTSFLAERGDVRRSGRASRPAGTSARRR